MPSHGSQTRRCLRSIACLLVSHPQVAAVPMKAATARGTRYCIKPSRQTREPSPRSTLLSANTRISLLSEIGKCKQATHHFNETSGRHDRFTLDNMLRKHRMRLAVDLELGIV